MTDIAAIKERHFSCCSATKTDHSITPDFPEHCVADDQPWPCDAAQLLALLADTPSVEPAGLALLLAVEEGFEGTALRIPNPGQRRAIVRAAEDLRVLLPTQASDSPERP